MTNNKRQTFLFGAFILICANMIVKIIGAVFRIPIYKILGGVGYANYQDAYALYAVFFAISTAGLPVAIQRMVAVANANQNYEEENKIFRFSLILFILVGAAGTAAMMFGANAYSVHFAKNPDAYLGIMVLAPTLFFVCIMSAYRGYFQGRENMIPTSVSEIIGALGKAVIGIAAAMYALDRYGPERFDIVAAFAIAGLTIGVAGGALYMFIEKILSGRGMIKNTVGIKNLKARKNKDITKEIIKISVPIMMSSAIASMAGIIDSFMMKRRLMDINWAPENVIAWMREALPEWTWDFPETISIKAYGDYFGMAVPFSSLPNTLVVPIAVSIITVIAAAFSEKNQKTIRSTIESTFRVTLLIAMPAAFGLATMSKPILILIYPEKPLAVEAIAPLLTVLSVSIVFVCLMTVTNAMLNAQGQERKPIISMACGMIVKIISSYVLIGIPEINKFGTPVSTVLCYMTIMCINFYFLAKHTKIVPPIRRTFLKPFMASAVMAICTILSYILFNSLLNGSRIAVIAALAVAVLIYGVLILVFKTLTKEDVMLLPKGEKLYAAMKKKRLID
jgi:stage V sporulation protein B